MALSVNHLTGFGGGESYGNPLTYSYLQTATDSTNTATYTFSSQNFGTAATDRTIVAVISYLGTSTTAGLNSATIGGISATISTNNVLNGTAFDPYTAIIWAAVPTGASGDVVLNLNTTAQAASLSLYAMYGEAVNFGAKATENANP